MPILTGLSLLHQKGVFVCSLYYFVATYVQFTWRVLLYATYFATLVHTSTATTNTANILGGAIGGIMLLFIILSIMMWYVMHCHKKKKLSCSTGKVHSMLPVTFHNTNATNYESSHVYKLTDNTKNNITGLNLGLDSRTCK